MEAVAASGELRELHALRADRMQVIPGPDGWPEGYVYTANGESVRFIADVVEGVRPILHLKFFHPANDHYGLSKPPPPPSTSTTPPRAGTRRCSTTPRVPRARSSTPPATATFRPISSSV